MFPDTQKNVYIFTSINIHINPHFIVIAIISDIHPTSTKSPYKHPLNSLKKNNVRRSEVHPWKQGTSTEVTVSD